MKVLFLIAALAPCSALADIVVATHVIRAHSIVGVDSLTTKAVDVPGAIHDPSTIIGLETRVVIYPGRPILPDDVGPPALIERNQIVTLIYEQNGLSILTEGRSLSRAGQGESARIMNLSSRKSVIGQVLANGSVRVSK